MHTSKRAHNNTQKQRVVRPTSFSAPPYASNKYLSLAARSRDAQTRYSRESRIAYDARKRISRLIRAYLPRRRDGSRARERTRVYSYLRLSYTHGFGVCCGCCCCIFSTGVRAAQSRRGDAPGVFLLWGTSCVRLGSQTGRHRARNMPEKP